METEQRRAATQLKRLRASDHHHLEVVLGHAAIRAGPGVGNVFPARARGDAFFRQPERLVVDEAADHAHPGAIGSGGGDGFVHWSLHVPAKAVLSHRGRAAGSDNASFDRDAPQAMPRGSMNRLRRGLYLVTPDEPDSDRLLARVAPLLAQAACLQYRNKRADADAAPATGARPACAVLRSVACR